jgi:SAM-dependent methyltransferase
MNAQDGWWTTFFQGVTLEFWSRAITDKQTLEEADFLQQELGVAAGGRVLDVPCGNGRLALALAGRGLQLTGVDLAVEYIDTARERSARERLPVEWHRGDMRDLPWQSAFNAAYCFGNSFAYFDDTGNAAFLAAVARALKSGARFVLDTGLAAESVLPKLVERTWVQLGDLYFLAQRHYDPASGVLRSDYTFLKDGKVDSHSAFYHVYLLRELLALCERVGFTELKTYSSLDRQPFVLGSPRLLVVAQKG